MTSKVGGDAGVIMIDKNGKVEKYYSLRLIFEQWMPQFYEIHIPKVDVAWNSKNMTYAYIDKDRLLRMGCGGQGQPIGRFLQEFAKLAKNCCGWPF